MLGSSEVDGSQDPDVFQGAPGSGLFVRGKVASAGGGPLPSSPQG